MLTDAIPSSYQRCRPSNGGEYLFFKTQVRFVKTTFQMSVPGNSPVSKESKIPYYLRDKKMIPEASPPSNKDIDLLYRFFDQRSTPIYFIMHFIVSNFCDFCK